MKNGNAATCKNAPNKPLPRAQPRQRRAILTKNRLFEAAMAEFSANGFHGARVDRIAARAGVNKQRLYAMFGSKAALFKQALKTAFIELETSERDLCNLTEADAPNLGETILTHYLKFHDTHPRFWRLLAWKNLSGGARGAGLGAMRKTTFQHLRKIYAIAQKRGIHSQKTSFPYFLFTMTALSYFAHSNQKTIKSTLGLDLFSQNGRKAFIDNISALISPRE